MKATEEMKNALSTLGVSYEEYGGFLYDFTFNGEHLKNEMDLVWCGLFGFSKTGILQDELDRFYNVLEIFKHDGSIEPHRQIYAYLLNLWGYSDFAFSIYKQELTDKGKALYTLLHCYYYDYDV